MSNITALSMGNPVERLARVLKENQSKLNLSKDGHVSVNLSNDEAVNAIKQQMGKLKRLNQAQVK